MGLLTCDRFAVERCGRVDNRYETFTSFRAPTSAPNVLVIFVNCFFPWGRKGKGLYRGETCLIRCLYGLHFDEFRVQGCVVLFMCKVANKSGAPITCVLRVEWFVRWFYRSVRLTVMINRRE